MQDQLSFNDLASKEYCDEWENTEINFNEFFSEEKTINNLFSPAKYDWVRKETQLQASCIQDCHSRIERWWEEEIDLAIDNNLIEEKEGDFLLLIFLETFISSNEINSLYKSIILYYSYLLIY